MYGGNLKDNIEDVKVNNIDNIEDDKQDLENPVRKTDFEKSHAKNHSENNEDDEQDLENPARKFSENNEDEDEDKAEAEAESETEENNVEDDNIILSGGGKNKDILDSNDTNDIEYSIDYLIEDDEKLINVDNVKNQVETYIDNYNSETMQKYRMSFNKLYQKYSNKKYRIKILPVNDKYKSTKLVVVKNDIKESNTIVTELIKPHYIYYNDEHFNLYDFKNKVSNVRAELLYKYEILVSKINITPEEKTNFEKERNKFVKLLEDYYSYTLYHKKINKISTLNTTQLIVQSKYNIHNDNDNDNETMRTILSGDTYTINNDIINEVNTNNIDKLTQYNTIILQLTGKSAKEIKKDSKLIEEIKLYLNKSEKEKLIKQIEVSKNNQDTYINYIVSRLPNI
jgi:hypothetical protein